jgi:hypothetical protein
MEGKSCDPKNIFLRNWWELMYVRQIAANLQHVLVEKSENSAPNTATRIILSTDGAKHNNDKQCEFVFD